MNEPAVSPDMIARDPDGGTPGPAGWQALWMSRIDPPAAFGFTCYGKRFDAAIAEGASGGVTLSVEASLGALPYSAESRAARQHINAVVRAGEDLPYAEISLSSTQEIRVSGTMEFPVVPAPAIIAAAASVIVIAVKPVIDLISMFRALPGGGR